MNNRKAQVKSMEVRNAEFLKFRESLKFPKFLILIIRQEQLRQNRDEEDPAKFLSKEGNIAESSYAKLSSRTILFRQVASHVQKRLFEALKLTEKEQELYALLIKGDVISSDDYDDILWNLFEQKPQEVVIKDKDRVGEKILKTPKSFPVEDSEFALLRSVLGQCALDEVEKRICEEALSESRIALASNYSSKDCEGYNNQGIRRKVARINKAILEFRNAKKVRDRPVEFRLVTRGQSENAQMAQYRFMKIVLVEKE